MTAMVPAESDGWAGDIAGGRLRLGMTMVTLWIGYFGLGGNGSLSDVDGWLSGMIEPSAVDHNLLAQALNEVFSDRGQNHPVRYSDA